MVLNGAALRAFVPIMVVVSLPHIDFFLFHYEPPSLWVFQQAGFIMWDYKRPKSACQDADFCLQRCHINISSPLVETFVCPASIFRLHCVVFVCTDLAGSFRAVNMSR